MKNGSFRSHIAKIKPARLIAGSFALIIIVGTILLLLPISDASGEGVSFIDALFTATSATCVTGLVTRVTATGFTIFGQYVILALIQLGGLGLTTIIALVLLLSTHRLLYKEKMILGEAINIDSKIFLNSFVKFVFGYVLIVEGIGVLLLALRFVPEYGWAEGLHYSFFTSISAFCNAGFDNIGATSLLVYQSDWLVSLVVSGLIIAGGLGFFVWFNLYETAWKRLQGKKEKISYHAHIVLKMTAILLAVGTLIILVIEFNNPATLGNLNFFDKILASFFQSTTLRTAGFFTFDISQAHVFTKLIMCIFMFIGGSPGGTAGGIKTTTFFIIMITMIHEIKNLDQVVYRFRTISKEIFRRSFAILILSLTLALSSILFLTLTENTDLVNIVFEVFSALGTVGLSLNYTPSLTSIGKFVIILLMFIGRVGPITIALILNARSMKKKKENAIHYPEGRILIG